MSSPIFLGRFQRQNRYIFNETVDMLHEQVDILDEQFDMLEMFENFLKQNTVSELFRKCFPVCQEVVGIKKRPDINF